MPHKVIDLHCDSVFSLIAGKDLRQRVKDVQVDLPRLREGRVGLQVFAAYVPPGTDNPFSHAIKKLDAIEAFSCSDENLTLVETALEASKAIAAEKIGIMLAVENGLAMEDSLQKLEQFRRRKVRIMTLVHSEHLPWIASCTGSGNHEGLSNFGEMVIEAMNDLGIIPDVSHSSENAFWAVLKKSKKPIIASHSCAYSLCASPRNLKDDQLKALGDSGGLVGVNFFSAFLSEAFRQAYVKNNKKPDTSIKVPWTIIADHIDHIVETAGIDAAAIGSDFDGISAAPDGVTGSDFYPLLENELRTRGYSEKNIGKIFNGNFQKFLSSH